MSAVSVLFERGGVDRSCHSQQCGERVGVDVHHTVEGRPVRRRPQLANGLRHRREVSRRVHVLPVMLEIQRTKTFGENAWVAQRVRSPKIQICLRPGGFEPQVPVLGQQHPVATHESSEIAHLGRVSEDHEVAPRPTSSEKCWHHANSFLCKLGVGLRAIHLSCEGVDPRRERSDEPWRSRRCDRALDVVQRSEHI